MVSRSARLAISSALRRALISDFDSGEESPAEEEAEEGETEAEEGEKLTLFFFFGFDLGFGGGAGDASDEEASSSESPGTPVVGPTDTGIGAAARLGGVLLFVGVVLAPLVTAGELGGLGYFSSDVLRP